MEIEREIEKVLRSHGISTMFHVSDIISDLARLMEEATTGSTRKPLKVKFAEGNKVCYGQDFQFGIGVPHDVEFTVDSVSEGGAKLHGPNHGGEPYGNGAIHISWNTSDRPRKRVPENEDDLHALLQHYFTMKGPDDSSAKWAEARHAIMRWSIGEPSKRWCKEDCPNPWEWVHQHNQWQRYEGDTKIAAHDAKLFCDRCGAPRPVEAK